MKDSQFENKAKVQQPKINPDGSLSNELDNPMFEGLPNRKKVAATPKVVDPNPPVPPHIPDMPDVNDQ